MQFADPDLLTPPGPAPARELHRLELGVTPLGQTGSVLADHRSEREARGPAREQAWDVRFLRRDPPRMDDALAPQPAMMQFELGLSLRDGFTLRLARDLVHPRPLTSPWAGARHRRIRR